MRLQIFLCQLLLLASVVAVPLTASADPFVIRTSRPDYPNAEVARPLILEKEWLEFSLALDTKSVTQFTDADGNVRDADYDFSRSVVRADIRYGLTSKWNVFLSIPYIVSTSVETAAGVTAKDRGLGDLKLGVEWEFFGRREKRITSAVLRVWTKQASGTEARGSLGDNHIILGTGTTDLGVMVLAKQQLPFVAVYGRAGYVRKFSDIVQYVFDDTNGGGLNGRFKLGDEIILGGSFLIQPTLAVPSGLRDKVGAESWGPVGLLIDVQYSIRDNAAIGPTSDDLFGGGDLSTLAETGGNYLDMTAKLLLEPTTNWTLALGATIPLASQNSDRLWPLEDQTPSYGVTYNGSLLFRW